MALTKTATAASSDWTAVAQNTVGEGATIDISDCYDATLFIQAFLDSATAHTGTEFKVQLSNNSSGDEDWYDLCRFVGLIGTSNAEPLTNDSCTAGTTVFTCASTTGYTNGTYFAIEDGTLVNSEILYQVALTTNTSITALDGCTNAHNDNTGMWSIADNWVVTLPMGAVRARLVVNNTYDADGSTLNYKFGITEVTAL